MSSPTQSAQNRFTLALREMEQVWGNDNEQNPINAAMRDSLKQFMRGMGDMAVGLRATYQLIEQMQKDLQALQRDVQALKQTPRPRP